MTTDRVRAVVAIYKTQLDEDGVHAIQFGKDGRVNQDGDFDDVEWPFYELQHARWMCDRMDQHLSDGNIEKAMRWLGFIQGVLWVAGIYTIAEMKDQNRP